MITPRSHAYLKTMRRKLAKFQNGSWKTVGGVAHRMYALKMSSDAEK